LHSASLLHSLPLPPLTGGASGRGLVHATDIGRCSFGTRTPPELEPPLLLPPELEPPLLPPELELLDPELELLMMLPPQAAPTPSVSSSPTSLLGRALCELVGVSIFMASIMRPFAPQAQAM
jgi:hypothetical protein